MREYVETAAIAVGIDCAALKFSAFCRAIGWTYVGGPDPQNYHAARNYIAAIVKNAVESPDNISSAGLISAVYSPAEEDEPAAVEITISLETLYLEG